ncbi:LuxR family transcriptional regulator [Streptomyces sp. NPDC048483]|uniref:LuxR family transcriptional regulator n=1 Tax=Streptomyces sp. NPDC048483 TaxID=3154927 RepID=UPI00342CB8E5
MADLLTEAERIPVAAAEPACGAPGADGAELVSGPVNVYGEAGPGRDEVELALMQARRVIESTISIHRSRPGNGLLIVMGSHESAVTAVERLVRCARHSVSIALSGDAEQHGEVIEALLAALTSAAQLGVAVRLLVHEGLLSASAIADLGRPGSGCEVRVAKGELHPTFIVDGRISLVRPVVSPSCQQVAIVKDPAAVRAIDLLFAGAWGNAVRLVEYLRLHERLRTDLAQHVLRQLCEGCTDLVAARESKVSLRTYRRRVAEIMQLLGASSRYQAGVRVVELGLLPTR